MSRATPRRAAGRWIASDSPKQPFFDFNSNPLRRGAYDYVGMIGRAGQGEQAIRGIGSAPAVVGLQAQAIAARSRHQNLAGRAAMSGRRLKYAAAALFGTLATSAGAADLLPPAPSRYAPHLLPLRQSAPGSITGNDDARGRGNVGWGTTFLGPSVTFSTDPSGVIGGTLFDDDYQLSPNWLTGT
jgi:hypothetical protein